MSYGTRRITSQGYDQDERNSYSLARTMRPSFPRRRESTAAGAAYIQPEVKYQITYHMLSSRKIVA